MHKFGQSTRLCGLPWHCRRQGPDFYL